MADELLALALIDRKTATCADLDPYEREGIPVPTPSYREVIVDGSGNPRCDVEHTDVFIRTFESVDATFARGEGEGDISLENWRHEHEQFCRRISVFRRDGLLVCKRFSVVEKQEPTEMAS